MPATNIPLTFRLAPLPMGFVGTPQQLASAIVARLSAVSANTISFFASGSVAPTSNVGPWLKNDQTWYVWSDTLATYIPQVIEPASLGYIFSQSAPDQNIYKVWYKLDGSNNPIGIFVYANGAWVDVYASQFANYYTKTEIDSNVYTKSQTDSAIAAAVGGISTTQYSFSYFLSGAQPIASADGTIVLNFNSKAFDIGDNVSGGVFTAPVSGIYLFEYGIWIEYISGFKTGLDISIELEQVGAGSLCFFSNESGEGGSKGRPYFLVKRAQLAAGAQVRCRATVSSSDGATSWNIQTNEATYFSGGLVERT